MKTPALFFYFFIFLLSNECIGQASFPDQGQYKTTAEKLKAFDNYINEFKIKNQGDAVGNALVKMGREGLLLCKKEDAAFQSNFLYWIGLGFEREGEMDSAVAFYSKTVQCPITYSYVNAARAMTRLYLSYYNAADIIHADSIANSCIKVFDSTKNNTVKGFLAVTISEYYFNHVEYEKAIEYKLKGIDLQKADFKNNPYATVDNIGMLYNQVGSCFYSMGRNEKAIEYYGYALNNMPGHRAGKANLYIQLMNVFIAIHKPDSVVKYYDALYKMPTKEDSLFNELAGANMALADYWVTQNDISKAAYYCRLAIHCAEQTGDKRTEMDVKNTYGIILYRQGFYDAAINIFKGLTTPEVYELSQKNYASNNLILSGWLANKKDWEPAYRYLLTYTLLHDSLITEASKISIAQTEAKYQNKEKQQQIEIKNTQLSFAGKQRLWLVGGLVLTGLLLLLLVIIYRNKKRTADILEEANETKAKLFSIISHDLRSPISQVYQFLKLQQLNPDRLNETQKQQLNEKIQAATGSLLEAMEDLLLWSKTQMARFNAVFQPTALLPVIERCEQLLQLNIEAKNITAIKDILPAASINTDEDLLRTIVRNLLQNAVKAAPQNSIIKIVFAGNVLTIANLGEPFTQQHYEKFTKNNDPSKGLSGLGLNLVDELSKKINATVHFENPLPGETIAVLSF